MRILYGLAFVAMALGSQGCLVLSMQPVYGDESIAWDDALIGQWSDAEDQVKVTITPGEWRSYRIHYEHPIEEADFTGRLTVIGNARFLDLMPARGLDYGAVLIPAHLVVRIARDGDRWQAWAVDYDQLRARVKSGQLPPGFATFDERQNVVLTAPTAALRDWFRGRTDKDFDAPATFERINP